MAARSAARFRMGWQLVTDWITSRPSSRWVLALVACALVPMLHVALAVAETDGTRLTGLRTGPYAVGFEVRQTVDPTRHVAATGAGTALGVAV